MKLFYLVSFDIVNDRVRYRVVKVLKHYGVRVQKSVFECGRLTEKQFLKMRHRLEDLIDHGEDSVRYYPVCRDCLGKVELSGTGRLAKSEDFKVV